MGYLPVLTMFSRQFYKWMYSFWTTILVEAQPKEIPMLIWTRFQWQSDFSSGSWHQSWRLTRLIPGRLDGGFWWSLVTNSWHTSLMEVIRRSPVEVGGWHPIYFAKFYTSLVVSRISEPSTVWAWAHLADVDLSWCVGCLMVDGFFKLDLRLLDAWKKENNIIPNGGLMVIYHGMK